MRQRAFGPTGRRLPTVAQGTWHLEQDDRATAIAALRRGVELGMSHIDTAEDYAMGYAEGLIGEAIAPFRRDELFLASKVSAKHATYTGTIDACERSLRRLGVDYLDLYLLRGPACHPLPDAIHAFDELQRVGKIRHFGLSGFGLGGLKEAVKLAGPGRLACNQVAYHLGHRDAEDRMLGWCLANGVALVGYCPPDSGRTSRVGGAQTEVLERVAAARGATTQQVVLAFLVRQDPLFTVAKSAQVAHVERNAAAGSLVLTESDLRAIDRAFRRTHGERLMQSIKRRGLSALEVAKRRISIGGD